MTDLSDIRLACIAQLPMESKRDDILAMVAEIQRRRALPSRAEPREHDGRNIAEAAPHAAYCDIAMQDAQIEVMDNGERIWMYDDALFDKSLAGNGWKVVPVAEPSRAEVVIEDADAALSLAQTIIHRLPRNGEHWSLIQRFEIESGDVRASIAAIRALLPEREK